GKADIVIPVAFYFTSVEQFQAWINDQTGNTAATPYTAKFHLDLAKYENILNEIGDKYVALDFSGATRTTFSPSYSATNRDKIVSVILPNSVTSIGNSAFSNCTSLATVTVRRTDILLTTLDSLAFSGCPLTAIYVPAGSVDAYKAASGWSAYAGIIEAMP
ncbi:MAG: leucine-rich repeat domain-containing protein, partial [Treponema sp.]|nr:leucine-rich repeat domain-containing protein [Treponema sp.]